MGFKVEEEFRIILVMKEVNLTNGWVYEQVCLAEYSNLPINLMANLLIYRVSSRFLFIN